MALAPVHRLTLTVRHHKTMKESEHQRGLMELFLSSRWRTLGRARKLQKIYPATRRTQTRNLKVNLPGSQALAMTFPCDSANVNEPDGGGDMGLQSPCILALYIHTGFDTHDGIFISFRTYRGHYPSCFVVFFVTDSKIMLLHGGGSNSSRPISRTTIYILIDYAYQEYLVCE